MPTNSVESSTARTKRGDLGAPRKRSQRAANATVDDEERSATAIVREPMQPERGAEVQSRRSPDVTSASTRPNLDSRVCRSS